MKLDFKLNMDMQNFSYMDGSQQAIESGADEDYSTVIQVVIPITAAEITPGTYHEEYKGSDVEISVEVISGEYADPLARKFKDMLFGASGAPESSLPFKVFSDNRSEYPAYLIQAKFPYRIAEWIKKEDFDLDEFQVISKQSKEKILALIVFNKVCQSWRFREDRKLLTYDDI